MNFLSLSEKKQKNSIYALLLLTLCIGVFAGSFYLARGWNEMSEGINSYLSGLFANIKENNVHFSLSGTSLMSNVFTIGVIFILGFFKFGCIGTGAMIIRRGFVTGFAAASLFKAYGTRGMLILLSTMPVSVVLAAVTLVFSAISIVFSLNENKFQKKILFSYIIFFVLALSIFCAASYAEGFLTTTFIKLINPNLG